MTKNQEVENYVQRQDRVAWRRRWMKLLLRPLAFNILWDVEVRGLENIPPSGATILMMNHITAIDPIIVMGIVMDRHVIAMSKVENRQHPLLKYFLMYWDTFTVNRDVVDRNALQIPIELLKRGHIVLIAPEGTRNPQGLGEAKNGLSYIASKTNATIIPTAISYAQGWDQSLKRGQRHRFQLSFGKPFRFAQSEGSTIKPDLQTFTTQAMYQLSQTVDDPNARGVYADVEHASTDKIVFL
ncbi:MAG: lysophospholipid acyltransferase family protein [Phototrophicaceae bacterium]